MPFLIAFLPQLTCMLDRSSIPNPPESASASTVRSTNRRKLVRRYVCETQLNASGRGHDR